jgi:hypothetical protein
LRRLQLLPLSVFFFASITFFQISHFFLSKIQISLLLLYLGAMSSRQLAILSSAVSSIRYTNAVNCQPENPFWDSEMAHLLQN